MFKCHLFCTDTLTCWLIQASIRSAVCLTVCLSYRTTLCPSQCTTALLSAWLTAHLSHYLTALLSACFTAYPSACLAVWPANCQTAQLSHCLSVLLQICLITLMSHVCLFQCTLICLYARPSACLTAQLSHCLPYCTTTSLSVSLRIWITVCLTAQLPQCLSDCITVSLSALLHNCLTVCLTAQKPHRLSHCTTASPCVCTADHTEIRQWCNIDALQFGCDNRGFVHGCSCYGYGNSLVVMDTSSQEVCGLKNTNSPPAVRFPHHGNGVRSDGTEEDLHRDLHLEHRWTGERKHACCM